jgi:hypothetical protein
VLIGPDLSVKLVAFRLRQRPPPTLTCPSDPKRPQPWTFP